MTRRFSRTTGELWLLAWSVPAIFGLLAALALALAVLGALSPIPLAGLGFGLVFVRLVAMIQSTLPRTAGNDDRGDPVVRLKPHTLPEVDAQVRAAVRDAGFRGNVTVEIRQDGATNVEPSASGLAVGVGLSQLVLLDRGALGLLLGRDLRDAFRDPHRRTAAAFALRAFDASDARFSDGVSPLRRPMHALTRRLRVRVRNLTRAAEIHADSAAAGDTGRDALACAIAAAATVEALTRDFWFTEVQVVLHAGQLPPFATGLRTFASRQLEAADPDSLVGVALSDPSASEIFPAPGDRVGALGTAEPAGVLALLVTTGNRSPDDRLPAIEAELISAIASRANLTLTPATWHSALLAAFTWNARSLIADHREWLEGLDLESVPSALMALGSPQSGEEPGDPRATALLALLALTLLADGWTFDAEPGAPYLLRRDEVTTWPFAIGAALQSRDASREDFHDWCRTCGVERLLDVDEVLDEESIPASSPLPDVLRHAASAPATAAGIPASEELVGATTGLWSSRSEKVVGVLGLGVLMLFAAPVIILPGLRAVDPGGGDPVAARLAWAALAAFVLALVVRVLASVRRSFLSRPTLTLDATGALTIVHPALLRTPLVLPRDVLLAADVDTSDSDERFAVLDGTGPLTPAGPQILGFLWDRVRGSRIPLLDAEPGRPNVAIVLRRAVEAPRPTRGTPLHSTLKGERIDALLLRSADPDAARDLLANVGILRPLTAEDLEAAAPVS